MFLKGVCEPMTYDYFYGQQADALHYDGAEKT